MKSNSELQLAELSAFVHGILAAFHCLGIAYNLKRKNRFDTLMHTAAVAYDLHAVYTHLQDIKELRNE